jgi:hypothetical protein
MIAPHHFNGQTFAVKGAEQTVKAARASRPKLVVVAVDNPIGPMHRRGAAGHPGDPPPLVEGILRLPDSLSETSGYVFFNDTTGSVDRAIIGDDEEVHTLLDMEFQILNQEIFRVPDQQGHYELHCAK